MDFIWKDFKEGGDLANFGFFYILFSLPFGMWPAGMAGSSQPQNWEAISGDWSEEARACNRAESGDRKGDRQR